MRLEDIKESQFRYYLRDEEEICMVNGDMQISRHKLLVSVNRLADKFEADFGDRVILYAENRPEWISALFSVWMHSAIAVPVDAAMVAEDLSGIVRDCEPKALFCTDKNLAAAMKAKELSGVDVKIVNIDTFTDTWDEVENLKMQPKHENDQLAILIYTSGTTGTSKGCMISFHNLEINYRGALADIPIWTPGYVRLPAILPFHHIFPFQAALLMPLMTPTGKLIFTKTLSGPELMKMFKENHVTILFGVPRLYEMFRDAILKKIKANPVAYLLFKLSKLIGSRKFGAFLFKKVQDEFGGCVKYCVTGGAPLDYSIYYDMRALGFEIIPGAGMSEASPVVSFTRPGNARKDSAGQPLSCTHVKIAEDGEILVSGENVFHGYWHKPEETKAVFTEDGWLHTGDLGYLDKDNFLYYTGRKKELLVLPNGKKVSPYSIEQKILERTDLIEEIAVTQYNNTMTALILPAFEKQQEQRLVNITESIRQDVIAAYNLEAEPYLRVLKCVFTSEPLPKTRLGKIQRFKLPSIADDIINRQNAPAISEPVPDTAEYKMLYNYLHDEKHCDKVRPNDNFEIDLGLDSLSKVELMVFLNETFGDEFHEQILVDYPTPKKLAEHLHEKYNSTEVKSAKIDWGKILQSGNPDMNVDHFPIVTVIVTYVCAFLARIFSRPKFTGMENVPQGPCIFAINHQSYLDGLYLTMGLDFKTIIKTFFYIKKGHAKSKLSSWLAERNNFIIVDVNAGIKNSMLSLAEILRNNRKVAIFPEGTRTPDGKIGTFKDSFAILARELGVPIVPVTLDGVYEILPRSSHFPRLFQSVKITYHPAFVPDKEKSYREITEQTKATICSALPEQD